MLTDIMIDVGYRGPVKNLPRNTSTVPNSSLLWAKTPNARITRIWFSDKWLQMNSLALSGDLITMIILLIIVVLIVAVPRALFILLPAIIVR
jgi:hypothetical protein